MELLLQAAPAVATDPAHDTPLHLAIQRGHTEVVRRLLQAAPAAAMRRYRDSQWQLDSRWQLPLHVAVRAGNIDIVGLLAAAAPAAIATQDAFGRTPLRLALATHQGSTQEALVRHLVAALPALGNDAAQQQLLLREVEGCLASSRIGAARALLACMPCSPALLELLSDYDVGGSGTERSLFADLVERQPLSQAEWDVVPFPCPGLASALPTVLARSEAEAGQLVAHLSPGEQRCLRTAALCLHRASRRQLPAPLSSRILAEALACKPGRPWEGLLGCMHAAN